MPRKKPSQAQLKKLLNKLLEHQRQTRKLKRAVSGVRQSLEGSGDFCLFTEMFKHARQQDLALKLPSRIYFLQGGDYVKIGRSTQLQTRIGSIKNSVPMGTRLLGWLPEGEFTEHSLHQRFRRYRHRGEWFHYSGAIMDFVKNHCQR